MNSHDVERMVSDPWLLTREEIDAAERDLCHLLGPGVESLLRPELRPEHRPIVDGISRLGWRERPVDLVVREAFSALVDATVPGGPIDPGEDGSDVPWCAMLRRMLTVPILGSKKARQWFALQERFRWNDVPVSSVSQGVAAYAIALMEHLRGRNSEAHYWMRVAAVQTEGDEPVGLGVAVVIRSAKLLTGSAT